MKDFSQEEEQQLPSSAMHAYTNCLPRALAKDLSGDCDGMGTLVLVVRPGERSLDFARDDNWSGLSMGMMSVVVRSPERFLG